MLDQLTLSSGPAVQLHLTSLHRLEGPTQTIQYWRQSLTEWSGICVAIWRYIKSVSRREAMFSSVWWEQLHDFTTVTKGSFTGEGSSTALGCSAYTWSFHGYLESGSCSSHRFHLLVVDRTKGIPPPPSLDLRHQVQIWSSMTLPLCIIPRKP